MMSKNAKEEVLSADVEEQDETDGPFERLLQLEIRKQVEAAWQVQQKIARLAWTTQPLQASTLTPSSTLPMSPPLIATLEDSPNDDDDDDKNSSNARGKQS
jgi:hypothetical protein